MTRQTPPRPPRPRGARRNPETWQGGEPRSPFGRPSVFYKEIDGQKEEFFSALEAARFLGISRYTFDHHWPRHPEALPPYYVYEGTQRCFRRKDLEAFKEGYLTPRSEAEVAAAKAGA